MNTITKINRWYLYAFFAALAISLVALFLQSGAYKNFRALKQETQLKNHYIATCGEYGWLAISHIRGTSFVRDNPSVCKTKDYGGETHKVSLGYIGETDTSYSMFCITIEQERVQEVRRGYYCR